MFSKLSMCALVVVGLTISVGSFLEARQQKPETKGQDRDRIVIPSAGNDAVARRDFMRTKMMYTQNVFQGLIVEDFDIILKSVEEIEMITEGEQWVTVDNKQYQALVQDFTRSIKRLREAAESENVDATALRYYDLSTRCIDCHRRLEITTNDL